MNKSSPTLPLLLLACALIGFSQPASAAPGKGKVSSVDKAGRTHVAKGYVPMKAAPGSAQFQAPPAVQSSDLPRKVDLRPHMTAVENQGETSSCVANALAGAYEYWLKRTAGADYDVSRLFVYYNARWRAGDQDQDAGSIIQLAMEGLKEFGACDENTWPFEKPLVLEKPNRDAYEKASQAKVKEMQQVPLELDAWKQALASGLPVVFGCLLFDSFDECNRNGGVVPMPSPKDVNRSEHAGHAMTAVGYSDAEKVFIVRNSWGDDWGDRGYCYMPYNYLLNPQFNGGDSWVFIPENPIEDPQDTWFDNDDPVIDDGRGVDYDVNAYDVDDYQDVEIVWWEEETVDYVDESPEDYVQYVEYADEESWEEMDDFSYEEVVEEWEEENPDEDSSLESYDDEDLEDEEDADVEDEDYSDEDADEEDYDDEDYEDEEDEEDDADAEDEDEDYSDEDADEEDYDDEDLEDEEEDADVEDEDEDYSDEDADEEDYDDEDLEDEEEDADVEDEDEDYSDEDADEEDYDDEDYEDEEEDADYEDEDEDYSDEDAEEEDYEDEEDYSDESDSDEDYGGDDDE